MLLVSFSLMSILFSVYIYAKPVGSQRVMHRNILICFDRNKLLNTNLNLNFSISSEDQAIRMYWLKIIIYNATRKSSHNLHFCSHDFIHLDQYSFAAHSVRLLFGIFRRLL